MNPNTILNLVEWFWTFQGEGTNAGRRAFFVRVPFCNLKCSWCDTEFNKYVSISEDKFLLDAQLEPSRFAVITGGEPAMNKQTPRIVSILKSIGFQTAIESNGTFPIPHEIDFVTISPKRESSYIVDGQALGRANEIKIVVDDRFDFSVAKRFELAAPLDCRLLLSPEFGNFQISVKKIEDFIKENPAWRLSLQTHKWIGVR